MCVSRNILTQKNVWILCTLCTFYTHGYSFVVFKEIHAKYICDTNTSYTFMLHTFITPFISLIPSYEIVLD